MNKHPSTKYLLTDSSLFLNYWLTSLLIRSYTCMQVDCHTLLPMKVHLICFICLLFRTILYVSVVYCTGNLIVSMTSLPPLGAGEIAGPMIGLFLIALGTGGIKPCVSAFGGDQFTSDQSHLLQSFFSVFYFAINAGSLLSMLITPVLRGGHTKRVVINNFFIKCTITI